METAKVHLPFCFIHIRILMNSHSWLIWHFFRYTGIFTKSWSHPEAFTPWLWMVSDYFIDHLPESNLTVKTLVRNPCLWIVSAYRKRTAGQRQTQLPAPFQRARHQQSYISDWWKETHVAYLPPTLLVLQSPSSRLFSFLIAQYRMFPQHIIYFFI